MRPKRTALFLPPLPSARMLRLAYRNYKVWRRLMLPSLSMNIAEPLIFLLGFGLGMGAIVGTVGGESYISYIAAGMVGYSVMNCTSFEALYSAFARMHVQRTWEGILNTPMTLDDVLLGEWLWAALKGTIAGGAILLVILLLGEASWTHAPLVFAAAALIALAFSGLGLAVNAVANSYDFFSYYFTLFITPMMMLSGAFFPLSVLPPALQTAAAFLPLTHAVTLVRPLVNGDIAAAGDGAGAVALLPSMAFLAATALVGLYLAAILTRRRLLK